MRMPAGRKIKHRRIRKKHTGFSLHFQLLIQRSNQEIYSYKYTLRRAFTNNLKIAHSW